MSDNMRGHSRSSSVWWCRAYTYSRLVEVEHVGLRSRRDDQAWPKVHEGVNAWQSLARQASF